MNLSEFAELLEIGLPAELSVSLNGTRIEIRYGEKGIGLDPTPVLDNADESLVEVVIQLLEDIFQKVGAF